MNVGFLIISKQFSGAENALYHILDNIDKRGIDLKLITNKKLVKNYSNLSDLSIYDIGEYFSSSIFQKPLKMFNSVMKANTIIKKLNLDILVLFLSDSLVVHYFSNKNKYKKCILSLRGEEIYNFLNKFKPHNKFFLNKSLKKSDKILSVSSWQIRKLSRKFRSRLEVVPNGVDSKIFKSLKNIKQKNNVIFFTGRFIKLKGINEILEVAKQLPKYEFWFAGQGPLANKIKGTNIKNLGFQTKKNLNKLYNQSTICILPSYHEGFSNVGLEVTSCGRALICTPKGFSEYIENSKDGIIIPAKDSVALKNAIIDLMENPKKRKMIEKNARKKALKYSWDKIAKQYLKVFEEVVSSQKQK